MSVVSGRRVASGSGLPDQRVVGGTMSVTSASGRLAVLLLALAFVAPVAAHGGAHAETHMDLPYTVVGVGAIEFVSFNLTQDRVELRIEADGIVDVVIMIGAENATEPAEWYVLHLGNHTYAVDQAGATLNVTGSAFPRSHATSGTCVVVAAEAWDRIDHQRQRTGHAPADLGGLDAAWGAGDRCQQEAEAPAPLSVDKEAPLGFVVPATALIALLWFRRV